MKSYGGKSDGKQRGKIIKRGVKGKKREMKKEIACGNIRV